MKSFYLMLITLCFHVVAKAQTEYLVTVDPVTGTHSIISSIPPVNWVQIESGTVDKNSKRYIFIGVDFGGTNHLYCLDALTGSILSQPVLPASYNQLRYNNNNDTLYGLWSDTTTGQINLVAIDIPTALPTVKAVFPFAGFAMGSACLDEGAGLFYIQNSGTLYNANVTTGAISSVATPTDYYQLQYDNASNKLYGMDLTSGIELVEINTSTGGSTLVATLTSGFSYGFKTIDEINHYYTYYDGTYLNSVDLTTGLIVYGPAFPVAAPGENVIEINYDNASGILYGLHWGQSGLTTIKENADQEELTVYPNPTTGNSWLKPNKNSGKVTVKIFDASGRLQFQWSNMYSALVELPTRMLCPGIYTIQVLEDEDVLSVTRLVKQ